MRSGITPEQATPNDLPRRWRQYSAFSKKWASVRKSCINTYTLHTDGLAIKQFALDEDWFRYIAGNRIGKEDHYADADIIIGPIANDTLHDTYGIIFSGLISSSDALRLLKTGTQYTQINVKSERAAAQLQWEGARLLTAEELAVANANVRQEEIAFRSAFEAALKVLPNYAEIKEIIS